MCPSVMAPRHPRKPVSVQPEAKIAPETGSSSKLPSEPDSKQGNRKPPNKQPSAFSIECNRIFGPSANTSTNVNHPSKWLEGAAAAVKRLDTYHEGQIELAQRMPSVFGVNINAGMKEAKAEIEADREALRKLGNLIGMLTEKLKEMEERTERPASEWVSAKEAKARANRSGEG